MGASVVIKNEEDLTAHKPVMLFGRDVTQVACFRNSMICGICTGVVAGLACFLGTSKTLFSTHVSFASLWVGVFAYWIPCRYKFESKYILMQKLIQEKANEKDKEKQLEVKESKENTS